MRHTRKELDVLVRERAGCVQLRYARSTGSLVGVYRADEAGMEDDPEWPWATVCEDHGNLVCHASRSRAIDHAPAPEGWCEECSAALGNIHF